MKHKYILILLVFGFLVTPSYVLAYDFYSNIGTAVNPLYVEIQPSPSDQYRQQEMLNNQIRSQNQMTENTLISLYGSSNFNSCYNSYCSGQDITNPTVMTGCLSMLRPCLERKKSQEASQTNSYQYSYQPIKPGVVTLACDDNKVLVGDKCYTPNGACQNKFGQYSASISFQNRNNICDCDSGHLWNDNRTECLDPDNACKNKFGQNSVSISFKNKNNLCDCVNGYEWNQDKTECILSIVHDNKEVPEPVVANSETIEPIKKVVAEKISLPDKKIIRLEEKNKVNTSTPQVVVKTEVSNNPAVSPTQSIVLPDTEESKRGPSVFSVIKSFFKSLFKLK